MNQTATTPARSKLDRMRPKGYVPKPVKRTTEHVHIERIRGGGRAIVHDFVNLRMPGPSITKLTRQGVRDLNGPRMNGFGFNGRASTSCPHYRDPQSVGTWIKAELVMSDDGLPTTKRTVRCALCNGEMGNDE